MKIHHLNAMELPFRRMLFLGFGLLLAAISSHRAFAQPFRSPVQTAHLVEIQRNLLQNGLAEANVALDDSGRVSLSGTFEDNRAVDMAFSLAQSVVGVRWVSPVTPENVRRKDWAKKLSTLFPTKGATQTRPSGPTDQARAEVQARPSLRRGEKLALVVGVGKFREARINSLKFAAKDAGDFFDFLTSPSGGGFSPINTQLILDEQATRTNLEASLKMLKEKASEDDLVVLYFSSHGTPPNSSGSVQIVTHDTIVVPRYRVWETSLSDTALADFIQSVRSRRLVVILDTCYSNGAYKRVENFLPAGGKSLMADDEEGFGISRQVMTKRLLGAKDLIIDEAPSPQIGPMEEGWGRVLISASDAGERSWESDRLNNSFFTYHLIRGMRNGGDIRSAFEYAKPRVINEVHAEKDQTQTPQVAYEQKNWAIRLK